MTSLLPGVKPCGGCGTPRHKSVGVVPCPECAYVIPDARCHYCGQLGRDGHTPKCDIRNIVAWRKALLGGGVGS